MLLPRWEQTRPLAFGGPQGKLPPAMPFPSVLRRRWPWAVLGGLLLTAAYPKINLAGLAWIAPAMILFSSLGTGWRTAFRLGYLAGLTHWLTSLYWLLFMPFPLGAVVGWLALGAYLALYQAAWVALCWVLFDPRILSKRSAEPSADRLKELVELPLVRRWIWGFACAAIWVALEMIRARLLTGFPWNFLAVSQLRLLSLVQVSSITGPYGLSFVMVWFSVALGCACGRLAVRSKPIPVREHGSPSGLPLPPMTAPSFAGVWLRDLLPPALMVLGVFLFGVAKLKEVAPATREIKIALVQPSVPQSLIWDPKENTNRFRRLLELSRTALTNKTDLLLWPEGAVPGFLRYDADIRNQVIELARKNRVWIILGADDAEVRFRADGSPDPDYFNASFLIAPDGELVDRYAKQHLLMFGEYIPFGEWLPFLKLLAPIGEGFKPGERPVPFVMEDLHATASVLICFEDVIPHLARKHAVPGVSFLIDLTNDGWYRESAAQWQHAANSAFRAVENGLPLVRCANNGITCWIDRFGAMHEVAFRDATSVYGSGVKYASVPLPPLGTTRTPTFYSKHGDWFGWVCVAAGFAMVLYRCLRAFPFASTSTDGKSGPR